MSWYEIITVLHVVSAALGVGAAAASDSVFLGAIRNRRVSHDQFLLIRRSSYVVLMGLTLLVLTGIALLLMNVDLWINPNFQAKMTVVFILIINGIIFHARVIPLLEEYQHFTMPKHLIAAKQWLLAITGSVSGVCWFSALIIAVIGNIGIGYWTYMLIVLFLAAGGSVVAYFLLAHIIFRIGRAEPESIKAAKQPKGEKSSILLMIALLVILALALGLAVRIG